MSICGYNSTIGKGLELLIEGMALELKEKVTPSNSPLKVIQRELVEISVITEKMQKAQGLTEIEMYIGLNLLAKSLFHNVSNKLSDSSAEDDLVDLCNDIGKNFISILEDTENYSESIKKDISVYNDPEAFAHKLAKYAILQAGSSQTNPR